LVLGSWGLGLEGYFVDLAFVLQKDCEDDVVDRLVSWVVEGCIEGHRWESWVGLVGSLVDLGHSEIGCLQVTWSEDLGSSLETLDEVVDSCQVTWGGVVDLELACLVEVDREDHFVEDEA